MTRQDPGEKNVNYPITMKLQLKLYLIEQISQKQASFLLHKQKEIKRK